MDPWFVANARELRLAEPIISTDIISPWIAAQTLSASGFEQTGKLVPFRQVFGQAIDGAERSEALSALEKSDYVVLTTAPKTGDYPFYEKIRQYWDALK